MGQEHRVGSGSGFQTVGRVRGGGVKTFGNHWFKEKSFFLFFYSNLHRIVLTCVWCQSRALPE